MLTSRLCYIFGNHNREVFLSWHPMSRTPKAKKPPLWSPMFSLPNVHVKFAIQVEGFALVPTDDFRLEAIKKKQPRLRSFLKRSGPSSATPSSQAPSSGAKTSPTATAPSASYHLELMTE